ncbi:ribonuclease 3 [mine drainage metagenome]|uniref:ribonuclease III n=1 Tax=mine drainage metagenome TaxID=410659 RepID=A0A1J5RK53_9ZZZZ
MQIERLEQALGHRFSARDLLRQALTHRSHGIAHNERLEFLGDSILNFVIAALLFERFGALREGDLSRLRASLVRKETLAEIAQSLSLGDYLLLGEGEQKSGGHRRPSILADTLEALIGAVYLDAGFTRAQQIIAGLYEKMIALIEPGSAAKDPKTALQEILQSRHLALPNYCLCATRGEAHAQEFEVECRVPALDICAVGIGPSRRAAEQAAAARAAELIAP